MVASIEHVEEVSPITRGLKVGEVQDPVLPAVVSAGSRTAQILKS
jgi:hypothetical protein